MTKLSSLSFDQDTKTHPPHIKGRNQVNLEEKNSYESLCFCMNVIVFDLVQLNSKNSSRNTKSPQSVALLQSDFLSFLVLSSTK